MSRPGNSGGGGGAQQGATYTAARHFSLSPADYPVRNIKRIVANRSRERPNELWFFISKNYFVGEQAKRYSHLTKDASMVESVSYIQRIVELFMKWCNYHTDEVRPDGRPPYVMMHGKVTKDKAGERWVGRGLCLVSQTKTVCIAKSFERFLAECSSRSRTRMEINDVSDALQMEEGDGEGSGHDHLDPNDPNVPPEENERRRLREEKEIQFIMETREAKKKRKAPQFKQQRKEDPKFTYTDMTTMDWRDICLFHIRSVKWKEFNMDAASSQNISNPRHPFNPFKVFSRRRFMEHCKIAGAHREFWEETNSRYSAPHDPLEWRLPLKGEHFARVRRQESEPGHGGIWRYYFPDVPRPNLLGDRDKQRRVFIANGGDEAIANQIFNKTAADDVSVTEKSVATAVQEMLYNAKTECGDTPDGLAKFSVMAHRIRKGALNQWLCLKWNPDANVSLSQHSVIKWTQQHLVNKVTHRVIPRFSSNLDSFSDKLANINTMTDHTFSMRNLQQELFVMIISAIQVPLKTKLHLHILMTGPPAIGKTFLIDVLCQYFISGTVVRVQHASLRANTEGGCQSSNTVRGREECVTKMMKDNPQNNGDTSLADYKSVLSESEIHVERMGKDAVTGTLEKQTLVTELNCAHVNCLNDAINSFDVALLTRFYKILMAQRDCAEWRNLRANTKAETPQFTSFKEKTVNFMCFQQAMTWMMMNNTEFHSLPSIDLEVPNIIFQLVMEEAAKEGIAGTNERRNIERLQFAVQSMVAMRAVQILWESPGSPLEGQEMNFEHILLAGPYLWGRVDDARKALTLLQNQFESPLERDILKIIETKYFDVDLVAEAETAAADAAEAALYDQDFKHEEYRTVASIGELTSDEELNRGFESFNAQRKQKDAENMYVTRRLLRTKETFDCSMMSDREKATDQRNRALEETKTMNLEPWQKIRMMATEVVALFGKSIIPNDVIMLLNSLLNTHIPYPDGKTGTYPALKFTGDSVCIAKKSLRRNKNGSSRLVEIMERVMHHRHSKEGDVMLCSMSKQHGIFDIIHTKAGKETDPLLKVSNFNFLDDSTRMSLARMSFALRDDFGGLAVNERVTDDDKLNSLKGVFSEYPFYYADVDLDSSKCVAFARQNGYTKKFMTEMKLPPADPIEYEKFWVREHAKLESPSTLKPYPEMLGYTDMASVVRLHENDSKIAENKQNYNLSSAFEESRRALQGTFDGAGYNQVDEDDDVVDHGAMQEDDEDDDYGDDFSDDSKHGDQEHDHEEGGIGGGGGGGGGEEDGDEEELASQSMGDGGGGGDESERAYKRQRFLAMPPLEAPVGSINTGDDVPESRMEQLHIVDHGSSMDPGEDDYEDE